MSKDKQAMPMGGMDGMDFQGPFSQRELDKGGLRAREASQIWREQLSGIVENDPDGVAHA
jgi:hypothetical protein